MLLISLVAAAGESQANLTTFTTDTEVPCGPCVCVWPGPAVDCASRSLASVPRTGLPATAISLNLHNNRISYLGDSAFKSFRTLESLDLSHNFIEGISKNAFGGLVSVTWLNLKQNRLSRFGGSTPFVCLHALAHLDLSHNVLTDLSEDVGLNNSLRWLDLSSNKFNSTAGSGMFTSLVSLAFLDLSHNQLNGIILPFNGDLHSPDLEPEPQPHSLERQVVPSKRFHLLPIVLG